MGLLNSGFLWLIAALVLLAAIAGKGIACWLAALSTGNKSREALGIGTLMNARGLMELIIINIGLERGIISTALFAILVIMAKFTTLMTSPMNRLIVAQVAQPAVSPTASRRVEDHRAAAIGRSLAGWQPAKRQTRRSELRQRLSN